MVLVQRWVQRSNIWAALAMLTGIAIVLGLGTSALHAQDTQPDVPRTITVTGTGTAYGTPDTVYVGVGVDRLDADIDTAVNGARTTVDAIIEAIRETGVEAQDIQTAYYNVFPEERFDETGRPTGDRQFRVSIGVNVVVRDIDNATTVITAALNAGATSVQNFTFGIADTTRLESAARTDAVADARARAEELAQILGLQVGEVVSVNEGYLGNVIPLNDTRLAPTGGGPGQVSPGQLSVVTNVQVVFAIGR